MADTKITDLTALAAASVADTDVLPIVDLDADETKKITATDLATYVGAEIQSTVEEYARDAVGTALTAGSNITITPNDGANTITIAASGGGSAVMPSLYGNGADGDVVISSDTTLTADMYYDDLTVNVGTALVNGGFKIFVNGTLTVNGEIRGVLTSGTGTANTIGAGGSAGGNGGTTTGTASSAVTDSLGGAGGAGGTGSGGAGGAGGAVTTIAEWQGGAKTWNNLYTASIARVLTNTALVRPVGGSGGGGGGGNGTQSGAQGGAGGGTVYVAARALAGSGSINANGRSGSAATNANTGGGGGGGGGIVILISGSTSVGSLTVEANGGTGGAGNGTGTAGSNGSAGRLFLHLGA